MRVFAGGGFTEQGPGMIPTMHLIDIDQTVDAVVDLDDRVGGVGFLDGDDFDYLTNNLGLVFVRE